MGSRRGCAVVRSPRSCEYAVGKSRATRATLRASHRPSADVHIASDGLVHVHLPGLHRHVAAHIAFHAHVATVDVHIAMHGALDLAAHRSSRRGGWRVARRSLRQSERCRRPSRYQSSSQRCRWLPRRTSPARACCDGCRSCFSPDAAVLWLAHGVHWRMLVMYRRQQRRLRCCCRRYMSQLAYNGAVHHSTHGRTAQ